jgi:hypothetical protein
VLLVAEFSTISYRTIGIGACDNRIQAPGVCSTSGHSQHGFALAIIAVVSIVMAWGAVVGRSRAAGAALIALGITVLLIALIGDFPDRNDTRGLEARYTGAVGHLGSGFKLELVGGVLLLLVGGLALARPEPGATREPRPRRTAEVAEPEAPPQPHMVAELGPDVLPEPSAAAEPPPPPEPPPPSQAEAEAPAGEEPPGAPKPRPRPKPKPKARGKGSAKPRPKQRRPRQPPNG